MYKWDKEYEWNSIEEFEISLLYIVFVLITILCISKIHKKHYRKTLIRFYNNIPTVCCILWIVKHFILKTSERRKKNVKNLEQTEMPKTNQWIAHRIGNDTHIYTPK